MYRAQSLDHWDMRTGRNEQIERVMNAVSLDHWDMRTGRNLRAQLSELHQESRSLGYAHWPELGWPQNRTKLQSRSLGYAHWPELLGRAVAAHHGAVG